MEGTVVIGLMGVIVGVLLCIGVTTIARHIVALRIVSMVAMEGDWKGVQEWEIRAMTAVLHRGLPRWVKRLLSEIALAAAALDQWSWAVSWYQKHQPREDTSLFPEKP